jgi:serine/threonine protein kinase
LITNYYYFPSKLKISYPTHFSPDLRDFLQKILVKDASRRLNINDVLNHKWLINQRDQDINVNQNVYRRIKDQLS